MFKTLHMKKFNKQLDKEIAHPKTFPGSKAQHLNHHSNPILQEHEYDGTITHDLMKNVNKNKDIGTVFISSIVHSTKVNRELMCYLNSFLHEERVKNGFYFTDNSEVAERDLWKDKVHLNKSVHCLVANNCIYHLNNFLGLRNHPIWNW